VEIVPHSLTLNGLSYYLHAININIYCCTYSNLQPFVIFEVICRRVKKI
jgi:hypothetical protein